MTNLSQGAAFRAALQTSPQRGLHKLQDSKRGVAVRFHPEAEVLEKLALKDGVALSAFQARSPAVPPVAEPSGAAAHCLV